MTIDQAVQLALQHHRAGRLGEAEAIYRQILRIDPRQADALHLYGVLATSAGRHEAAAQLIRQAIAVMPESAVFHSNFGVTLAGMGRLDEAVAAYRRAIELQPDYAEAHNNLGNALKDQGHLDQAVAAFRRAVQLKPDYVEALCNLGFVLREQRQLEESVAVCREAVRLRPNFAAVHNNLGVLLRELDRLDESIDACHRAIEIDPTFAEAHHNLGVALYDQRRLAEAVAASREAIQLKPDFADALNTLSAAFRDRGQSHEAIDASRRAIQIQPASAEAHNNLGNALGDQGHLGEAIAAFRRALAIKPAYAEAHNNLGNALRDTGRIAEAIAEYRRAMEFRPNYLGAQSNLLLALHYLPVMDAPAVAAEHRQWAQGHTVLWDKGVLPHANERAPERRLRIGYVSPDFRAHATAFFLEGLLANHERAQVEVFCYSDVLHEDRVSERLRAYVGQWRAIAGWTDEAVAELIRRDGIDILVDLAGHTAYNRLLVFARQPAPVQVTWLGYPNTTGLPVMNYRMTDSQADPAGATEHLHTETLVRLPDTAWCYRPPEDAPPISLPPCENSGNITFGCFNAHQKINDPLLVLWAAILQRVPGARLLLKSRSLADVSVRTSVLASLEKAGAHVERIELLAPTRTIAEHLAVYSQVDIALDTFPYHGTTTTCEALWMGVPVVTMAGRTHVSRVGASLLRNAGLPELVAESAEGYVDIAARLAGDVPRLQELRATLRARMAASPLMDAPRFARNVEQAYRQMWREWSAKAPRIA